MREQAKSGRSTGEKRQWSTPKMREIELTDEILAHFKLAESPSQTDAAPANKAAASR